LVCGVVAIAASFLAEHHGAPVMLFALLLGLALNFLAVDGACVAGIDVAARHLLRAGVALLGVRITAGQVVQLGWQPALIVVLGVVATIGLSMLAARALGFRPVFGLLSGGAVAICGASAAMALAAALPAHPLKDRAVLFTVVGVSTLSTVAMLTYPALAQALGLTPEAAGIFLGATIHDVAQVVGAGYGMSTATGDVATLVKLMRVAMLVPVIALAALVARRQAGQDAGPRPPLLPWFAVGFVALVALNSTGWLPPQASRAGGEISRWLLVVAIAAIGMKTRPADLAAVGLRPVLLMLGETVFLAAFTLGAMRALA
jgi:uncharacterized integral membrane protein (TIGR00698 family)